MYEPPHFRIDDVATCHGLITRFPLGTLVTLSSAGIEANHIPFVLDPSAGEFGTLKAHLARANGQWKDVDGSVDGLVVFQAADAYVTPSLYPSKTEHGKVVPTWNYVVVHAYGPVHIRDDDAWLAEQIDALTRDHEGGRAHPWAVTDAPDAFIAAQRRGIVGLEIPIRRLIGKAKVSQNRPMPDRQSVHSSMAAGSEAERFIAEMLGPHLAR